MSESVSWYRLILHPADPLSRIAPPEALQSALAAVGLIGEPFQFQGREYHQPGERFLELVVFLGCSPVIELQRQDDSNGQPQMDRFCHIHLPPELPEPQLHVGDGAVSPRCPHCRAPVEQWQQWLDDWTSQPMAATWSCPACGRAASAAQLNWRQGAGVLRSGLELGGIHPYEAVPADELLASLEQAVPGPWRYYYARP